jgi:hypothetical protein
MEQDPPISTHIPNKSFLEYQKRFKESLPAVLRLPGVRSITKIRKAQIGTTFMIVLILICDEKTTVRLCC